MPRQTTLLPSAPTTTGDREALEQVVPSGPAEALGRRSVARWLSPDELAGGLRHHARGSAGAEASVELIVRHRYWLTREDFRDYVDARPSLDSVDELMACIDWERVAAQLPPGPREAQAVLAVAAALAGGYTAGAVPLSSLDAEGVRLVLRAVLHAAAGAGSHRATVSPFPVT